MTAIKTQPVYFKVVYLHNLSYPGDDANQQ